MEKQRIVIVGGGFAGVACALDLAKKNKGAMHIRLISEGTNFEYHGALYRLVAGGSPLEVCLPYREIFKGLDVDVVEDKVVGIDTSLQEVRGESGSTYGYEYLVLGLGAETNYFGIQGLEDSSFGMKTISDALELHRHITSTLDLCSKQNLSEQKKSLHFVIVGAGPTGVELAGELADYVKKLLSKYKLSESLLSIDLVERDKRILPRLDEKLARRTHKRLQSLGVQILCNTSIDSLQGDKVSLSGKTVYSPTVVWTAGVRAHKLLDQLDTEQDTMGRVLVNDTLRVRGYENVFVGGDCASTLFSGMAQTAIRDGMFIADCIERQVQRPTKLCKVYSPTRPVYAIPVGPGWAATGWGLVRLYGRIGWTVRRLADLKVFLSLLPPFQAWSAFVSYRSALSDTDACKH